MVKIVSLNQRESLNAPAVADVPIVLVKFSHESWDRSYYICSDWTEVLSHDPLRLGVRANNQDYDLLVMSAVLPDDRDGTATGAELQFSTLVSVAGEVGADLEGGLVRIARSIQGQPATVDFSVVMASDVNTADIAYTGMLVTKAEYSADTLSVTISREPIVTEPFPSLRMTKDICPALFK